MYPSDYESRRKTQNREAQRRYRQRRKQSSADQAQSPDIGLPSPRNSSSHRHILMAVTQNDPTVESTDPLVFDFTDMLLNYPVSCGGLPPSMAANDPAMELGSGLDDDPDPQVFGVPTASPDSIATSASGCECLHACHRANPGQPLPDALPNTHARFYNKISRVADDISRLYDFGVEMQLMSPDADLYHSLNTIKEKVGNSIHSAAKSYTCVNIIP